jgi:uncharacterized protein YigA (DUF484 family)
MSEPHDGLLLNDATVAGYLRSHPDFFERMPGLISELSLPHDAGQAVSLVERQVSILRERNIDMRKRLSELLGAATDNDTLFEKTRTLTLALVEASDLEAIDAVLATELIEGFGADCAVCHFSQPHPEASHPHLIYAESTQEMPLFHLTQGTGISCGLLRPDEFEALFGTSTESESSAAIVQLGHGVLLGLLAIGSRDPERFSPDMGTLFVRYIGDILARRLVVLAAQSTAADES